MSDSARTSTTRYLAVWGWLAGLMLVGVLLSELPLPTGTIVLLVLALSSVKAGLVVLYYMHLKLDRRLLALVALFPLLLIALAVSVVFSSRLIRL